MHANTGIMKVWGTKTWIMEVLARRGGMERDTGRSLLLRMSRFRSRRATPQWGCEGACPPNPTDCEAIRRTKWACLRRSGRRPLRSKPRSEVRGPPAKQWGRPTTRRGEGRSPVVPVSEGDVRNEHPPSERHNMTWWGTEGTCSRSDEPRHVAHQEGPAAKQWEDPTRCLSLWHRWDPPRRAGEAGEEGRIWGCESEKKMSSFRQKRRTFGASGESKKTPFSRRFKVKTVK